MEKQLILGLDVSTDTVGISLALVDEQYNVTPVDVTHLKLKVDKSLHGAESLFVKNDLLLERMKSYRDQFTIGQIVIEEPLIAANNSYTVSKLLMFNGIVAWNMYHLFGVIPQYISSYNARKYGMPELMALRGYNKKGERVDVKKLRKAIKDNDLVLFGSYPYDVGKKEVLWNWISEKYPEINWVTNKKGELKKENFDASDSLMCILGYVGMLQYGETEPQITRAEFDADGNLFYTTSFCGQTFEKTIERSETVGVAEMLEPDERPEAKYL